MNIDRSRARARARLEERPSELLNLLVSLFQVLMPNRPFRNGYYGS